MMTFWKYARKFSNFCFAMLLGNFAILAAVAFLMLFAGLFTGSSKRNITLSGPPSLDGPSVPWDVHVVHVAAHLFPLVELWTLALGVLPYVVLLLLGVCRHGAAAVRRAIRPASTSGDTTAR